MARSVDPLVIGQVIGDVVDVFVPRIDVSITYGARNVLNGCDLKPSIIADPPIVQISGKRSELFTLVMTDPDSPSPSDCNMREFVHWVVINIPGGGGVTRGEEVVPYLAPQPMLGIHRFVFVLFQQNSVLQGIYDIGTRAHFKTRNFSVVHELGPPVAVAFFNSQREPQGRNLNPRAIR